MIPAYARPVLEADAKAYAARVAGSPYADSAIEPDRWASMKFHFARWVWARRHSASPRKREDGTPLTWAQLFREMWGEGLAAYVERVQRLQGVAA